MTEMMKAARLHRVGEKLSIDRVEVPKVGPDDVLVDIKASGICHSDLNYRNGVTPIPKLPIIMGHGIAVDGRHGATFTTPNEKAA
jgi:propanol-preferring alcohol dehydrogenase